MQIGHINRNHDYDLSDKTFLIPKLSDFREFLSLMFSGHKGLGGEGDFLFWLSLLMKNNFCHNCYAHNRLQYM